MLFSEYRHFAAFSDFENLKLMKTYSLLLSAISQRSFLKLKFLCLLVFMVFGFTLGQRCSASGPTNEEQNLIDLRSGYMPMLVTPDGAWTIHVDSQLLLHRTSISDPAQVRKTKLPLAPLAIASSQDGQVVAMIDAINCVSLLDFEGATTKTRKLIQYCQPCPEKTCLRIDRPGQEIFGSMGLALSSNAKLLAYTVGAKTEVYQKEYIRVLDTNNGKILATIPETGTVLHLQFMDKDNKLLVVQATMNEVYEGPSAASAMQFFIWDLKKRELFSHFKVDAYSDLDTHQFLWSFAEGSGELIVGKPDPALLNAREKKLPLTMARYNLKQCKNASDLTLKLKGRQLLGIAGDAASRIMATLEVDDLHDTKNYFLNLRTAKGEIKETIKLSGAARNIKATPDGKFVFAIDSGKMDKELTGLADIRYRQGGKLTRVSSEKLIAGGVQEVFTEWRTDRCLQEDEIVQAREIIDAKKTARELYQLELDSPVPTDFDLSICHPDTEDTYSYNDNASRNRWGLDTEGNLWIDRHQRLEQLFAKTGKAIKSIATPRSASVCSLPIYAKKQFLSWQGDTVTLRSFADQGVGNDRKVFDRQPGNKAIKVVRHGEQIAIFWQKNPLEISNGKILIYDANNGKVLSTRIKDDDQADPDMNYTLPLNDLKPGVFRWEMSMNESVRARQRQPDTGLVKTVLWDGLKLKNNDDSSIPQFVPDKVVDFGNGKAAVLRSGSVTLYDANKRTQLARIDVSNPIDAQWLENEQMLFIETSAERKDNGKKWSLHAYKID